MFAGVFEAEQLDSKRYGLTGRVTNVRMDAIYEAISAGALPILSCVGESSTGQILNLMPDIAVRELAQAIQPEKVIYLTPTGALAATPTEVLLRLCMTWRRRWWWCGGGGARSGGLRDEKGELVRTIDLTTVRRRCRRARPH
jgi:hypothetical protein